MYASVNVGCEGKSGPGKIHEVILVQFRKSPKKIRALIRLKSCFYNYMEAQNEHELLT